MKNLFKKENCSTAVLWNYSGHSNINEPKKIIEDEQKQTAWNQTLLTNINLIVRNINLKLVRSNEIEIRLNSKFTPLIESLEFYNSKQSKIAGNYKVIFDDYIEEDIIYVYSEDLKNLEVVFVFCDKDGNEIDDNKVYNSDKKLTTIGFKAKLASDLTEEQLDKEKSNRMGYIQIENF